MGTLQTTDVIAISSAVIALCALAATIWQGVIARTHSRLSVRPHIDHSYSVEFQTRILLEVVNSGLGPGIIYGLNFENPKTKEQFSASELRIQLLSQVDSSTIVYEAITLSGQTSLAPGKSLLVLSFEQQNTSSDDLLQIRKQLGEMLLVIKYKCMYGNTFTQRHPVNAA